MADDSRPFFSVIIPTYNRAAMVHRTLRTVLEQPDSDQLEIIVVDDGSTDGTAAEVRRISSRIRVVEQPNAGPSAARNNGLAHARGRYIAFLDSDDLWFPWTVRTYRAALERAGHPAFLAGRQVVFGSEAELASVKQQTLELRTFEDYLASGDEWRWFSVSSFVIRTDELRRVGGFSTETRNSEDCHLTLKLGTAQGFASISRPATFAYRSHDDSMINNRADTLAGVEYLLREEARGAFPGGSARKEERMRVLGRHARPAILASVRHGPRRAALRAHAHLLLWHARTGRLRFLAGVPAYAMLGVADRLRRSVSSRP